MNAVGRRVVPPVVRLDDAALLEKCQCDGDLRTRQGFALDECLEREARFSELIHRVSDGLKRLTWTVELVRLTTRDMGADEFGSFVFGDLNCDGRFNGADIDVFFFALGDPATYQAAFPNCDGRLGDMNLDGFFNGADIDAFFTCLGGGGCP